MQKMAKRKGKFVFAKSKRKSRQLGSPSGPSDQKAFDESLRRQSELYERSSPYYAYGEEEYQTEMEKKRRGRFIPPWYKDVTPSEPPIKRYKPKIAKQLDFPSEREAEKQRKIYEKQKKQNIERMEKYWRNKPIATQLDDEKMEKKKGKFIFVKTKGRTVKLHPTEQYIRERVREPSEFQPKTLRTIESGSHKLIVGRPKGKKTTAVQAILHPEPLAQVEKEVKRRSKQPG
jgi:hypothetical protein